MHDKELESIIEQLRPLLDLYQETDAAGSQLNGPDRATAKSLLREAKTVLDESLGIGNEFSMALLEVINEPGFGFFSPPTLQRLREGVAAAEGGLRQLRRKLTRPSTPSSAAVKPVYVSPSRLTELRAKSPTGWDTKRLVRMLEELNTAHANDLHMTTAMLVRAISDHVPPIFGAKKFSEVANNVGGKSISDSLKHLDTSLRSIADGHLHAQIRPREVLPTASQVDFRQDLDVLLQEVVRVLFP